MRGFHSPRARLEFWLFSGATFALFTTYSTLALLAVVLKQKHMSEALIGMVLSAPAVPILLTMLLAGTVVARLGALRVAAAGAVVMLLSHMSFELTSGSFAGAVASRVGHGIGYAVFLPAAMIYADGKLTAKHKIYYFGIYASMFPLPNVLGPLLAETYLRHFGINGFFLYTAAPALVCVALFLCLTPSPPVPAARHSLVEYFHLLKRRALWTPYGGIFFVGLCYGFIISFMALLLESRQVPVAYFFISFTVCLFGSRFLLLRYVQHLPRPVLFGAALGLLALAFVLLAFAAGGGGALAAGITFGLGYSVAYPTVAVWVTDQFSGDRQGMPLTLYNAAFALGIFLLSLVGGYIIARLGMLALVASLAVTAILIAIGIAAGERTRGREAQGVSARLPRQP